MTQQTREQQLRQALEQQERDRQALAAAVAAGMASAIDLQRYEESIKDTEKKVQFADESRRRETEIQNVIKQQENILSNPDIAAQYDTEQVETAIKSNQEALRQTQEQRERVIESKASPFYDMSTGRVDVPGKEEAVKMGVSDKELRDIGLSQIQIVKARQAEAQAEKWKDVERKSDVIVKARQDERQAQYEKEMAQYEADVKQYEASLARVERQQQAIKSINEKSPDSVSGFTYRDTYVYKDGETTKTRVRDIDSIDLIKALKDGVPRNQLYDAGYDSRQISEAAEWVEQPAQARAEKAAKLTFGKSYSELTPDQQGIATTISENTRMYTRKTMPIAIATIASMEPITGTMYFWNEMTPGERALSISMDALAIFGNYLLPKVGGAFTKVISKTGVSDDIARFITSKADDAAKLLEKTDPQAAKTIKNIVTIQGKYADDLLKADELKTVINQTDDILKSGNIKPGTAQSSTVKNLLEASRQELLATEQRIQSNAVILNRLNTEWVEVNRFAESQLLKRQLTQLRGDILAAKTPAEKVALMGEAARLENLESSIQNTWANYDIVRYTNQIVSRVTELPNSSEINLSINRINYLTKQLAKLKDGKSRSVLLGPDFEDDIANADKIRGLLSQEITKLKVYEAAYANDIYKQILSTKESIKALEVEARNASAIDVTISKTGKLSTSKRAVTQYYDSIMDTLNEAKTKERLLQSKLGEYIESYEKLYPERELIFGRGGIATKIRVPPVKPMTSSGIKTESAVEQLSRLQATGTYAQAARLLGLTQAEIQRIISRPVRLPEPEKPDELPVTPGKPSISPTITPTVTPSPDAVPSPETSPQAPASPSPATAPATTVIPSSIPGQTPGTPPEPGKSPVPIPSPAPQPSPQPQPQPQPQPTQTPEPSPVRETFKGKFRTPPARDASDAEKRDFIVSAGGAVAWKQGTIKAGTVWHVVTEPYSQATHLIVVGQAPRGARIATGPGEAYKSFTKLSGSAPRKPVTLEGGAVDPTISERGISFRKDPTNKRRGRFKTQVRQSNIAPDVIEVKRGNKVRRHIKR